MAILLLLVLGGYAAGLLLPCCVPAKPRVQNILAHGLAGFAASGGIILGIAGLLAPEPFTMSLPSTLPLLTFAIRLDPLASFFVLTISLAGLSASIYALGYVTEFYGRVSLGALGSLFNGFLLSMTLVVIADNGFFFLIVWELMSLLSYFLVVTEHEKADVRYAGFVLSHHDPCRNRLHHPDLLDLLPRGWVVLVRSLPASGAALARRHENPRVSDGPDRLWYQSGHCAAPRLVALRTPGGAVAYLSLDVGRHDQDGDLRA